MATRRYGRKGLHESPDALLNTNTKPRDDAVHEAAQAGTGGDFKTITAPGVLQDEMEKFMPWADLVALMSADLPKGKPECPPLSVETMLRIHYVQRFTQSESAMEVAHHGMPVLLEFEGFEGWHERLHDESTILRARHVQEQNTLAAQPLRTVNALLGCKAAMPKTGTVADATLIVTQCSTKNGSDQREPDMLNGYKGQRCYLGVECHIDVSIDLGLVHTVKGTNSAVTDMIEAIGLLRESDWGVYADSGFQGSGKQAGAQQGMNWNNAMRPGRPRRLDPTQPIKTSTESMGRIRAGIAAHVEHAFQMVKRQFEHADNDSQNLEDYLQYPLHSRLT